MTASPQHLEPCPIRCPECDGRSLTWEAGTRCVSGVTDGRLRQNEVSGVFILGCDDCSETIRVLPASAIAGCLNAQGRPAPQPYTSDKPTVPGWYIVTGSEAMPPNTWSEAFRLYHVVRYEGKLIAIHSPGSSAVKFEPDWLLWSGPIPEPSITKETSDG